MEAAGAEDADGAAMDPASKKDYDNHPSGAGVVLYNQHMNAAEPSMGQEMSGEEAVQSPEQAAHATPEQSEHAAQQSHTVTQLQQDAQDEQQTEQVQQAQQVQPQPPQPPQPQPQPPQPLPHLQPPATQLRQAPLSQQQLQSQQPRVPGGGQKGAAAASDGEAGPAAAAGVIFGCTNSTYEECFRLSMVGLPRKYLPLVESIVAGHTLIFLFNFSDRQLHGVYIATSAGQACHAMPHAECTVKRSYAMQLCNARPLHCDERGYENPSLAAWRGAAHPRTRGCTRGCHPASQRRQPYASEAATPRTCRRTSASARGRAWPACPRWGGGTSTRILAVSSWRSRLTTQTARRSQRSAAAWSQRPLGGATARCHGLLGANSLGS